MMAPPSMREKTLVLLALATVIPGSWLMGGYFSKAPFWMGIGGWAAGLFALYQLFNDTRLRRNNPALKTVWILWLGFLVYLAISLLNPSYRPVEVPAGMTYMQGDAVSWLPSVVAVSVSAPMILQLSGSIVLAWSLLAVLRRRSSVRMLLFGLIVNAFMLSLVGAFFKVTGQEHILGYFKSVNAKFYASFTYHNHWVAFAGFHLFLATGLLSHYHHLDPEAYPNRSRLLNIRGFLWVCCFFMFLSLFLVESRAGLLVAVMYLSFLFLNYLRNRVRETHRRPVLILCAVLGLLGLGFVSYQIVLPQLTHTTDRIEEAWYQFWDEDEEVDNFRFNVGPKITSDLIEAEPVFGWGWGSYPFAMSIYAPQYLDNQMAQFAHNDWLQFISELGIVGLLLFVFPVVHMSAYFRTLDSLARFSRWGLIVLLILAFFEGPMTNPVVLASVLIVICSDLSVRRPEQGAERVEQRAKSRERRRQRHLSNV